MKVPPKLSGSGDRSVVNVKDDYELKYWIQVFDVTESQLCSAVKAVGSSTVDVSRYIKGSLKSH
jgi:hypothetical protein